MPDTPNDVLHLVLHQDDPYGAFVWSPQHPGLTIANNTLTGLLRDLDRDLAEAGVTGPYLLHTSFRVELHGRVVNIRFANDEHVEERLAVVERILDDLDEDPSWFDRMVQDSFGEYLLRACRREDLVIDLEAATAKYESPGLTIIDGTWMIVRPTIGEGAQIPDGMNEVGSVQKMRLDKDTTLGELIDSAPTYSPRGELVEPPRTAFMFERVEPSHGPSAYVLGAM